MPVPHTAQPYAMPVPHLRLLLPPLPRRLLGWLAWYKHSLGQYRTPRSECVAAYSRSVHDTA
eukprot:1232282-Rhodomonas_salina.2